MTITFTFSDFEEMESAVLRIAENIEAKKIFQAAVPEPPAEKERPAPKEEVHVKAEEPKKEEPAPKEEPKIDRAEMRKLLSALNKHTGKNTARELIADLGYKVLTEVPDGELPKLKEKAEEVLNA